MPVDMDDTRTSPGGSDPQRVLLELRDLRREFPAGDGTVTVLKGINLSIRAGEMVSIVGQSGSGKSTLMSILGCLDTPSSGSYRLNGHETSQLGPDKLAALRREYFGFVFQRYHLLSDLSAQENVQVPAIYSGTPDEEREVRSRQLLERLGVGHRLDHRPGKLSGGQQQRVSIARALMNGGAVILADEPTGALDSAAGVEVMKILSELHAEGHTIILVTHDMHVASHAQRIIELHDGEIIADRPNTPILPLTEPASVVTEPVERSRNTLSAALDRFLEAFHMAMLAMNANRLRTFLTMLGIIIGIASVVSVVALGEGSQREVMESISSIGTNTIDIFPGTGFGDRSAGRIRTLVAADATALASQSYADSATPVVEGSGSIRYGNMQASANALGVGEQFFQVRGMKLASGSLFGPGSVHDRSQVAIINHNALTTFFPHGEDPIGKILFLGNVPVQVIGVLEPQSGGFGGRMNAVNIYVPYTTLMSRITGQNNVSMISVRIRNNVSTKAAEAGITKLLIQRHGRQDFFLLNTDTIRQTIESTGRTMTVLISSIAMISLLVGGVGVMNIMLVSVTERTSEIGVRMAVGARRSDIQQQFLIEAVLVCVLGGMLGIGVALAFGEVFSRISTSFQMEYSLQSMVIAFCCASLIGVIFGYFPARNAARLNPIEALSRD